MKNIHLEVHYGSSSRRNEVTVAVSISLFFFRKIARIFPKNALKSGDHVQGSNWYRKNVEYEMDFSAITNFPALNNLQRHFA